MGTHDDPRTTVHGSREDAAAQGMRDGGGSDWG
jgi:hypothetical protein